VSVILTVPDFRDTRGKKYELSLLLFCLLLTELKNCRRQRQRVRWIKGNWNWIPQLWKEATQTETIIPTVSPSQSTLSRLLNKINLWALTESYYKERRIQDAKNNSREDLLSLNHYAFDGKYRKRIVSIETGRTEGDVAIFNVDTREVLATQSLKDKVGESTTGRSILKRVGKKLPRGIFTADAGFSTPKFTATVISTGHEYLLGFKENSGDVYQICCSMNWNASPVISESFDHEHGRKEVRKLKRMALSKSMSKKFEKYSKCAYLFSIESERTVAGITTYETRYYIGSKGLKGFSGESIATFIRKHWLQENGLHWVKDAILGEDSSFVMSNRSSRVLAFFKNIVISVGYSIFKSVQEFVDEFDSAPKEFTKFLFQLK
jgi:predicted transposase YbfD/YdcC